MNSPVPGPAAPGGTAWMYHCGSNTGAVPTCLQCGKPSTYLNGYAQRFPSKSCPCYIRRRGRGRQGSFPRISINCCDALLLPMAFTLPWNYDLTFMPISSESGGSATTISPSSRPSRMTTRPSSSSPVRTERASARPLSLTM